MKYYHNTVLEVLHSDKNHNLDLRIVYYIDSESI